MSRFTHTPRQFWFAALALSLVFATAGHASAALNAQEMELAARIINDGNQGRASVTVDATLSAVARAKAADMANREYFSHTNPDGKGANYLVRQAGYPLPSYYSTAANGNNIESLAAGYSSVSSVWTGWMNSPDHKRHILAETSFFAEQTALGVGFYEDSGSPFRYYWVILTAPPSGPKLTIASPAAGASVTSSSVSVTGSTGGSPVASSVQVRVENENGNGSYASASGSTSWNATISGLAPGVNTLRVRSIDAGGDVITETTRAVRYVVMKSLTVSTDGDGIVSQAFSGTTEREVGRAYSIGAAPRDGSIFSHWSGGEYSQNPVLTFEMREGLSLVANFIPNPFVARKGGYNGLLSGDSASHATSGMVRVVVGSAGAVTGSVRLGGAVHNFTGKLNPFGDATITIPRSGRASLTLTLDLDVDGSSDRISGTLSDGNFTAEFAADRAWQVGSDPSPFAGRYTVALPAATSGASTPQGTGWAVLIVSTSGVASLTGKLSDGAPISASAAVSRDGLLPLFNTLYSSLGSFSGSAQFRSTSVSDLDGAFYWHKPEVPSAARYRSSFSVENSIVGSRYRPPTSGQRVISLDAGAANANVTLSGGNLDSSFTQTVTVSASNAVTPYAPVRKGFTSGIATANGFFVGIFSDPTTNVTRRFEGVFLQKQNAGFGFFLGATLSGEVDFYPATE